jgi:hypothetical protein
MSVLDNIFVAADFSEPSGAPFGQVSRSTIIQRRPGGGYDWQSRQALLITQLAPTGFIRHDDPAVRVFRREPEHRETERAGHAGRGVESRAVALFRCRGGRYRRRSSGVGGRFGTVASSADPAYERRVQFGRLHRLADVIVHADFDTFLAIAR